MVVIQFILMMLIPLGVTIYLLNFARWMKSRGHRRGATGAYLIAALTFCLTALASYLGVR
jgi:hypothetical protein